MEDIYEWPTDLAISIVPHEDSWQIVIMTEGPHDADRCDMIQSIADICGEGQLLARSGHLLTYRSAGRPVARDCERCPSDNATKQRPGGRCTAWLCRDCPRRCGNSILSQIERT